MSLDTTFPSLNHDHHRCIKDVLARAEQVCAARRARFTPQRRRVLEIIASSHQALGAYDVLERMMDNETRPAPVIVYRALDFLMAHGLVHKISSDNTYLACTVDHEEDNILFLICSKCGVVGEISAKPIKDAVAVGAEEHNFSVNHQIHEVVGQCRHCRSQ